MRCVGKKVILASLLYATGLVPLWGWMRRRLGRGTAIFLTGHRVVPEGSNDAVDRMALLSGHAITPAELDKRLRFLLRWVMPAGRPIELKNGLPGQRRFYLTFDDGYRDNVEHAAPVLQRLGVEAVIFTVADLIEQPSAEPWWDRWGAQALQEHGNEQAAVEAYNRRCMSSKRDFGGLDGNDLRPGPTRRYLDAKEIAALPGLFHVANHTKSHANLACLDLEHMNEQLDGGERPIVGHPRYLPLLAYPFGSRSEAVLTALRSDRRFALAFATGGGVESDRHQLRRLNLNLLSFPLFAAQAVGMMR